MKLMDAIESALAKGVIALLWKKQTLKWLVRHGNENLAKKVKIAGRERYAEMITDALAELKLRGECVSDDGIVSTEECEKIIAFDNGLIDKYWKED